MAKSKESMKTLIAYAIICVSVIFIVSFMDNRFGIFDKIEFPTYDLRFRIRGIQEHADEVVIVAIDPQTLDLLGLIGMPPRNYHAALLDNLYAAGAKAVLFDVLFLVYTGKPGASNLESNMSAADSLLADAIFFYDQTILARKQVVLMDMSTSTSSGEPPLPIEPLQQPNQIAFVSMYQDSDSFVRRTQLIYNDDFGTEEGWQYSYALKTAMIAIDADTAWVDTNNHKAYVGDRVIPLDEDDMMYVNFRMDEQTYANNQSYISYEQVLDDSEYGLQALVKAGRIKDKVVLIGATYPEAKDYENTPFFSGTKLWSKKKYPMYGVHIHHNIASSIIKNDFLIPLRRWHGVLLVSLMAAITVVVAYKFRGFLGLFISAGLIVLYIAAAIYLFISKNLIVPIVAPSIITVILSYVSVGTYNFITERKQKAMIKNTFSKYVPGKVVSELLQNPEMLTLGGEERVMSVIFSDLEGFTSVSEGLTPQQLVILLNEYLSAMTDIVLENDGIIDKYEGDLIMAEFGAPLPDDDHAVKACLTALQMQKKLAEMRIKWKEAGEPELKARVGINSGKMVLGNMGSSAIFDYTVMGDSVNLSSRLEEANKAYKTYIMCSEATRQMIEHVMITRELDLLQVKGKTEGVLVHEVMCLKSDGLSDTKKEALEIYHQGLSAYKEMRWQDSIDLFAKALDVEPDDGPSSVYLDRCRLYLDDPPPDDWDGIFVMRTK
ncbi:CHASE2 domain-containing protein [Candidatus Latescibacterota bacterium]